MRRHGGVTGDEDRSHAQGVLAFASFEIDPAVGELRRDGRPVRVQPLIFDLLLHFVRHPNVLVTKDELIRAVWKGVTVSDGAISQAVSLLRRVLRQGDTLPSALRTVWGRGYRFVSDVWRPSDEDVPATEPAVVTSVGEMPLVGRADVLAVLRRTLHEAAAGTARVVLLSGEPGIGKTRLCREFAAMARAEGVRVLSARVPEVNPVPSFWPWDELRRQALAASESTRPLDRWIGALRKADASASMAAGDPACEAPEEARRRMEHSEQVASFWRSQAAAGPLVLIIDDAHRADAASLELLDLVADRTARCPVVFVATVRIAEARRDAARRHALGVLARRPETVFEHLARLSPRDVAEAAASATGRPCPGEEASALLARSGGNPFLLKELLRLDAQRAALPGATSGDTAPPVALVAASERHLATLSPSCRDILAESSVLGRVFDVPVLSAISSAAPGDVMTLLEEALRTGLLSTRWGGRFRFAHGLVCEALYASLSVSRRTALHGRAVQAIEEIYGADDSQLEALARHSFAAAATGEAARALHYGELAARRAARACAFSEAARHYRRTIAVAPLAEHADAVLLRLQVGLIEAAANAGEFATVRAEAQAALPRARRLSDVTSLARVAHALSLASEGEPADGFALRIIEEAVERQGDDGALGARLLAQLASVSRGGPQACALADQAMESARRSADSDALAIALAGAARMRQGSVSEAEACGALVRELERVMPRVRGPVARLKCRWRLLAHAVECGDRLAFDQRADAMLREAASSAHPIAGWYAAAARTARLHLDAQLADAEAEARRGVGLLGPDDRSFRRRAFGAQLAAVRLVQGRFGEDTEELWREVGATMPAWRAQRALGDALGGRRDRAAAMLTALVADDLAAVPRDRLWLTALVMLSELAIVLGRSDVARVLYEHLAPFADRHAAFDAGCLYYGAVARRLGLLAELCGRADEALGLVRAGTERDAAMAAPAFVALGQYECARLLSRCRGRAERREAKGLCEHLLIETSRLGLVRLRAEVETLLGR